MCRHLARPRIQTRTGGERGKRKAQERSARQDRLYVIAKLCGILRVAAAIQRRTSVKPSRYPFGALEPSPKAARPLPKIPIRTRVLHRAVTGHPHGRSPPPENIPLSRRRQFKAGHFVPRRSLVSEPHPPRRKLWPPYADPVMPRTSSTSVL
jgi:hypothetical protein